MLVAKLNFMPCPASAIKFDEHVSAFNGCMDKLQQQAGGKEFAVAAGMALHHSMRSRLIS